MRISDWSSDVCSSDLSIPCQAGALCPDRPAVHSTDPGIPFLEKRDKGRRSTHCRSRHVATATQDHPYGTSGTGAADPVRHADGARCRPAGLTDCGADIYLAMRRPPAATHDAPEDKE